jgi:hypothetical protein
LFIATILSQANDKRKSRRKSNKNKRKCKKRTVKTSTFLQFVFIVLNDTFRQYTTNNYQQKQQFFFLVLLIFAKKPVSMGNCKKVDYFVVARGFPVGKLGKEKETKQ